MENCSQVLQGIVGILAGTRATIGRRPIFWNVIYKGGALFLQAVVMLAQQEVSAWLNRRIKQRIEDCRPNCYSLPLVIAEADKRYRRTR